ncbi:hypothetical protein [Actinophytocola sp.]|uniref:hypothetical protein n=1 Tax=Actinophytocola sp. TaxID=1872138 RepID=UPI0038999F05
MPIARISVLRLLAAAVSVTGTAPMIRAGIAPYARPMPAPITAETSTSCRTADISTTPSPWPAATTTAPAISAYDRADGAFSGTAA